MYSYRIDLWNKASLVRDAVRKRVLCQRQVDPLLVRLAVNRLYSEIKLPEPLLIWVNNIHQLFQVPFLLHCLASGQATSGRRYVNASSVNWRRIELLSSMANGLRGSWRESLDVLCAQVGKKEMLQLCQTTTDSGLGRPVTKDLQVVLRMVIDHSILLLEGKDYTDLKNLFEEESSWNGWANRRSLALSLSEDARNSGFFDLLQISMWGRSASFSTGDKFVGPTVTSLIGDLVDDCDELAVVLGNLQVDGAPSPRRFQNRRPVLQDPDPDSMSLSRAETMLNQASRNEIYSIVWGAFSLDPFYLFAEAGVHPFLEDIMIRIFDDIITLKNGAFAFVLNSRCVIACKIPDKLVFDKIGRLSNFDGPAVQFADGSNLHFWRGMFIPDIVQAKVWTASEIENERNLELQRVLIDRYGRAKFLEDTGFRVVQADECGTLFQKVHQGVRISYVRVYNATPEADGSTKQYFLRVPPDTQTAKEGIAWTFGRRVEEYDPLVQT